MEELEGSLIVGKTKDGKPIYKAKFQGKKGPTEMGILPGAIYFDPKEAADGDPITIFRDAGQIKKVVIKGKTEVAPAQAKPAAAHNAQSSGNRGNQYAPRGGGNFGRPQSGFSQGAAPRGFQGASSGPQPQPATSPYNFIAQNCVLKAPTEDPKEDRYSGILVCSIKTLSPLLVGGVSKHKSSATEAARKEFFEVDGQYVIPGSSLKGLLRSTVEILTCSTMQPMNDHRVFWRTFDDELYKEIFQMGKVNSPQKAGYLVRHGADFEIIPVNYEIVKERSTPGPNKTRVNTGRMVKKVNAYDFDNYQAHAKDRGLLVNDKLIDDFLLQLTPNQEKFLRDNYHINGENDIKRNLNIPLPVFFLEKDGAVDFFGLARYFRYPAKYSPIELRDMTMAPLQAGQRDFAMQLFGFTDKDASRAGRVSFSPAIFPESTKAESLGEVILGQPHQTCFAHYLTQDKKNLRTMKRSRIPRWDINSLNTYNTPAKIRGRKFYWHRDFVRPQITSANKKFQTVLVPVTTNNEAECILNLERLTLVELGAILEALILPEGHAHKLGSAKSLGLGSVRIDLKKSDIALCQDLYANLEKRCLKFFGNQKTDFQNQDELFAKAREAFKKWLLEALSQKGHNYQDYQAIPHIAAFLRMTDFAHKPANDKTDYMDLKEFIAYRILSDVNEVK